MTLRFIGEVDRPLAEDLASALARIRAAPFELRIGGVGRFDQRNSGALWAGVEPKEPVAALAGKVDRACQSIGLEPERRAFHPHITLARWKCRRTREVHDFLERTRGLASEPFAVEQQGHFKPTVFLLADHGFNAYSTLIETRRDLVEKKPDLVQRFVDASMIGWYHYIYGDSKPGNDLIKKQNPEMTGALLAYSIAKMKEYVDSGDSLKLGIGAMSDATMKSFFDKMVHAGVVKAGIDYRKAYTLKFVNKGVGLNLRPK